MDSKLRVVMIFEQCLIFISIAILFLNGIFSDNINVIYWSLAWPLISIVGVAIYYIIICRLGWTDIPFVKSYLDTQNTWIGSWKVFQTDLRINWYLLIGIIILIFYLITTVLGEWGSISGIDILSVFAKALNYFVYGILGYLALWKYGIPRIGFRVGFFCALFSNAAYPAIDYAYHKYVMSLLNL